MFLFGSRVQGPPKPESDLDVAVIVTSGLTLNDTDTVWAFQHQQWEEALQGLLPVKLDLQLGNLELSTTVVGPAVSEYGLLIYRRE